MDSTLSLKGHDVLTKDNKYIPSLQAMACRSGFLPNAPWIGLALEKNMVISLELEQKWCFVVSDSFIAFLWNEIVSYTNKQYFFVIAGVS